MLQKGGIPRGQADAIAHANASAFESMVETRELATKGDLAAAKRDLELALAETKHEILKWVIGMMIAQTTLIITAFGIGIAILK